MYLIATTLGVNEDKQGISAIQRVEVEAEVGGNAFGCFVCGRTMKADTLSEGSVIVRDT